MVHLKKAGTLSVALVRISKKDDIRELTHSDSETVNAGHRGSEI